jgi:molecular chaperone HtpG
MSDTANAAEALEYRTEVKQLLDILAHSLYTDREIFLRELISNASDALNRVQFEMLTNQDVVEANQELAIWIEVDTPTKRITLRDSGIGMNRDELVQNLGTIAHSGAKAFLQNVTTGQTALEEIIGQFGVGFYSVFMVADEVTVTSRSFRAEDQAWSWSSRGDSTYTLAPADKTTRGTDITIHLKEDAAEFANQWRLEQIVKKHSDYVSFPIYLLEQAQDEDADQEEEEKKEVKQPRVLNRRTALWRQSPSKVSKEEYVDFYKQLAFDTEEPLLYVHVVADAPANVRSVLFVPAHRDRGLLRRDADYGLRLYSRKILIQQRNKELLPEYLRFVEGVVDSEDLPLNVSREMVQSNPVLRQLRRALTNRLHRELKTLAGDPERYGTFWQEFGVFIKEGVALDPGSREDLVDLLRFRTSQSGEEWVGLQQVMERMQPDQKAIYYVLGDDMKAVARSPHLDYFRAHNLEVLYLVDPIDGFLASSIGQYKEKPLQNVDDAGIDLPADESEVESEGGLPQDAFDRLVARVKDVLGEKVVDVHASKQLTSSPCRLVSPQDNFDRDFERIRRMTEENYDTPRRLLELNRKHPLVVNLGTILERNGEDPLVDATIEQLFDNALLLEGLHANPVDMVERIQLLMERAVGTQAG